MAHPGVAGENEGSMRYVLIFVLFLAPLVAGAAEKWHPPMAPPQEAPQPSAAQIQRDAQAEAAQYGAEVRAAAEQIAQKRAQRLSWLYFPAEVQWLGASLYYGNDWEARDACDEGRQCLPSMSVNYGAEVFVNPFASLDLVGRIGGASQVAEGFPTRHGLDASVLARWRLAGLVPILVGWRVTGTPYAQVGEDGRPTDGTSWTHRAYFGAGFRFRGATAEVGASVGLHRVLAIRSADDAVGAFSALVGVRLVTPALVGW